jgi:hypothetical protein
MVSGGGRDKREREGERKSGKREREGGGVSFLSSVIKKNGL